MKPTRSNISIAVLIIFHAVGLIGIYFGYDHNLLELTPLNLLLTLIVVVINHVDWRNGWVFGLTILAGFVLEVIGVNTGIPFGDYHYGNILGPKWLSTPLIIGVNWLILLYGAIAIARKFALTHITTALLAAGFMVLLDYLIEPVAMEYNFWQWTEGAPPVENYLAWFGASFGFALIWQLSNIRLNTLVATAVYAIEIGFFGILNLIQQ